MPVFPDSGPLRLVLDLDPDGACLPIVHCAGSISGCALLIEHSRGSYARPGLRGHRSGGRDWSPAFTGVRVEVDGDRLTIDAADPVAGLRLRTEVEALVGGALRARHTVTNDGADDYVVDGLEVTLPLPDDATELLDFTGRHLHERAPQRHELADGLWLRETRRGRTSLESPTMLIAGAPGFGFAHGPVLGAHVAFSGNSVLRAERGPREDATLGGGELLLPGEVTLEPGRSYTTPWVVFAAGEGLDDIAHSLHTWQRSLAAHPDAQPVTLNVWEAVYFDHDLDRLLRLAELAAGAGVERFVLDDGWFRGRRHDRAGLGDWQVDDDVWPQGLAPLADRVHELGMQFGLWFEPEMVNPESDLYRAHPDWILQTGGRVPALQRNQLVLDLTRPEVRGYLAGAVSAVLSSVPVDYIKWDHNRDLLEPGSNARSGAPAAHEQTLAFYDLLDDLRRRHPSVAWESCASGGGRIDLGVVEHVQRFWTSDMTDALARQQIQRWTVQLIAPEYLGAHVSSPVSHQTGRTLPLDFRAATAFHYAFGIEWDLTTASPDDLDRLARWIELHKQYRGLLHGGRTVRIDLDRAGELAHGVVSADRRHALIAHVQLDEPRSRRGTRVRVPGLDPAASYLPSRVGPDRKTGPTSGAVLSGAALGQAGLWLPSRRPETIELVALDA